MSKQMSRGGTQVANDEMVTARRTESIDAAAIAKLITSSTEQVFGRVNVVNMIERANLGVSLVNQNDELLGHASFFDYPNIADSPIGNWENWITDYINLPNVNTINCLFMHLFVARTEYSHGAASEIITTVFNAVPECHYVFMMVPKASFPESALSNFFQEVDLDSSPGLNSHVMFSVKREQFAPVLHVRQARVQDHDDLTPIFDRQSNMLTSTYGDFFLAELIEAQDESMHCLVAEIEGTAVGFMSLCSEVNLDLLNKCFDLGPINGLRKPHPQDVTHPKTPTPEPEEEPEPIVPPKSAGSRKELIDLAEGEQTEPVAAQRQLSAAMMDFMDKESMPDESLSISRASSVTEKPESLVELEEKRAGSPAPSPLSREPTLPQPATKFVPTYYGESNAFSIQLFCIDEQYEMRSVDLLRAAFSRMPNKSYALITVPHLVPEFPLLQKFTRISPRVSSTLSQELYVFHKMGLTERLRVRDVLNTDLAQIEKMTSTLSLKQNLLNDLTQYNFARRDQDGTEIRAYVAEVEEQIVGVALLRREEDIEFIRSHYNVEDFIYFNHHGRTEHAHLHHFALNPIFARYTKHFMKEIMRKSYKTSIYYPIYPPHCREPEVNKHSYLTCMNELVPVRSRRQITYPLNVLEDRAPSDRVIKKETPYALCHMNRKLTLEPKVVINARIVVVGASTVGLAFLETLVFCPHLRFNNLVLISPHGLPGELQPDTLRDDMLGAEHCYTTNDHSFMSLRTWVNVVYGKMTSIDRSKKQVYVNNEAIVSYDHLVIASGEQHQLPMPTGLPANPTLENLPNHPDRWFEGAPPSNLMVVNDEYDAAMTLYKIEQNIVRPASNDNVVVYGNCLRAYSTVEALIKLGVKPQQIYLIRTPLNEPNCFNNPVIETAVSQALLEKYKIKLLADDAILADWELQDDQICSLTFVQSDEVITVSAAVMIAFTKKRVDLDAYRALNDACLVFDGKLVIDSTFHTNDVAIRAAGSATKYQRRYHADEWSHSVFNSKEIGVELASAMLTLFDPTLESYTDEETKLKLIPLYKSPKVQSAVLPGDLHYLHVSKPSLNVPQAISMMNPDYGVVLSTGEPAGKSEEYANSYFRLHFNTYNTVETITCLSKEPVDVSNLICLYGVHEKFLNSIRQRYKEDLIKDFYSFFREAWSLALYHDRFAEFRDEIRELLINQPASDTKSIESKVREMIDDDLQLSATQRTTLRDMYKDTGVKRAVETRLLGFLNHNYYHLPMFAKPGMV